MGITCRGNVASASSRGQSTRLKKLRRRSEMTSSHPIGRLLGGPVRSLPKIWAECLRYQMLLSCWTCLVRQAPARSHCRPQSCPPLSLVPPSTYLSPPVPPYPSPSSPSTAAPVPPLPFPSPLPSSLSLPLPSPLSRPRSSGRYQLPLGRWICRIGLSLCLWQARPSRWTLAQGCRNSCASS